MIQILCKYKIKMQVSIKLALIPIIHILIIKVPSNLPLHFFWNNPQYKLMLNLKEKCPVELLPRFLLLFPCNCCLGSCYCFLVIVVGIELTDIAAPHSC
jgi:hypothetical protein